MHFPCEMFQSPELTLIVVARQFAVRTFISTKVTTIENFGRCGTTGVYAGYTNNINNGSLMERSSGVRFIGDGQAALKL
jgi:hypothetical protein